MPSKKKTIVYSITLFVLGLVIGLGAGGYFWPQLGYKNPFNPVPTFLEQQLTIPNARILSLNNLNIVVTDLAGTKASFPLSKDFQTIIANGAAPESKTTQAPTLKVGDMGSIVLNLSGGRYQATKFFLFKSPSPNPTK